MRRTILCSLLLAAAAATACGSNTPTAPPAPDPILLTTTFSDSVGRNEERIHLFNSTRSGTVTATLSTLSPDSAATLGLSLGIWNGLSCAVVVAKADATSATQIAAAATAAGPLCARVAAPSTPVSYDLTVAYY